MAQTKPTLATIKKLFALSGNRCAFNYKGEKCDALIVDQDNDIIGAICHIEAAKKGWARYNESSKDSFRRSFENLLLLCPNHHKKIDTNPSFTVQVLTNMKSAHDQFYQRAPFYPDDALIERAFMKLGLDEAVEHDIRNSSSLPQALIEQLLTELEYREILLSEKEARFREMEEKYRQLNTSVGEETGEERNIRDLVDKGDLKTAEATLTAELAESAAPSRERNESIAKKSYELALIQEMQLKYQEAFTNFKHAVELQPYNIHYLNALAYASVVVSEYEQATLHYNTLLGILTNNITENTAMLGRTYLNIGWAYDRLGEYDEAIEHFRKAIEIFETLNEDLQDEIAGCLNNIGLAYKNLGRYEDALHYYYRSVKIYKQYESTLKKKALANTFCNLTALFMQLRNLRFAHDFGALAISIYKELQMEEHPESANAYYQFGFVLFCLDNNEAAISYTSKALAIYLGCFGTNHDKVASCYQDLSTIYGDLKDEQKALDYAEKAVNTFLRTLGPGHGHTINALKWLENLKNKGKG
ncbi:tetratricopeptide repeat protein [Mucilaginibacter psychrotolerans]|uniref:Tetratricopeptide repeat protein n=1 Tax=Mucilaginibacter psychrotolerans TaxID=1524096 RepID=A0A4Y8SFP2_9SPHI|nr:tetratricopeptide repeat protein [Mucilaginibacter psychrotolerans]TFF37712.1 tetratricopeptide repeat protein [Mucilaginibacter psychrotolerans]